MKRFIFLSMLLALVTFSIAANAQSPMQFSSDGLVGTSSTRYTDDTTTDTGTSYWYYKTVATAPVGTIAFYPTKVSGTAGGTAVIQKSLDGIRYEYLSGGTTGAASDSFTVANTSTPQLKTWDITEDGQTKYVYYRVRYTGTGTMVVKAHCSILVRK